MSCAVLSLSLCLWWRSFVWWCLIPHLRHSLQTGVKRRGFCQRSHFLITNWDTTLIANRVLRAGRLSGRISGHLAFTPASKGLRGPFVTSHNIYYVKSNMLVWSRLNIDILLIWWLMQQVNMPAVNNSSIKIGRCQSFGAQTVKTAYQNASARQFGISTGRMLGIQQRGTGPDAL